MQSNRGAKPTWLLRETGHSGLEADPRVSPNQKKKLQKCERGKVPKTRSKKQEEANLYFFHVHLEIGVLLGPSDPRGCPVRVHLRDLGLKVPGAAVDGDIGADGAVELVAVHSQAVVGDGDLQEEIERGDL